MIAVANVFGIKALKTLELMKIMYDCGHITLEKVKEIVAYWRYWKDKPKNMEQDYEEIFGELLP